MARYASATRGSEKTRNQIDAMLRELGANKVYWQTDFENGIIGVGFEYGSLPIMIEISLRQFAKGLLEDDPWTRRKRKSEKEWIEDKTLQAQKSVYSLLHDWFKAQTTIISLGLMDVEDVFLAHVNMIGKHGPISLGKAIKEKLPALSSGKMMLPESTD